MSSKAPFLLEGAQIRHSRHFSSKAPSCGRGQRHGYRSAGGKGTVTKSTVLATWHRPFKPATGPTNVGSGIGSGTHNFQNNSMFQRSSAHRFRDGLGQRFILMGFPHPCAAQEIQPLEHFVVCDCGKILQSLWRLSGPISCDTPILSLRHPVSRDAFCLSSREVSSPPWSETPPLGS